MFKRFLPWLILVLAIVAIAIVVSQFIGSSGGTAAGGQPFQIEASGKCFTSPSQSFFAGRFDPTTRAACEAKPTWGMWCLKADVIGAGLVLSRCLSLNANPTFVWPSGNCVLKNGANLGMMSAYQCIAQNNSGANPWSFFESSEAGSYVIFNEQALPQ